MSSISITKEFTWDMAHMLAEHEGLCKNLHGHTYKMQVTVTTKTGRLQQGSHSSAEMVVDFKDLKEIVTEKIIRPLDHAFMYWTKSPDPLEHELAILLKNHKRKIAEVGFKPTAEAMALYFFKELEETLANINLSLIEIKIWETPTSFAEVRR